MSNTETDETRLARYRRFHEQVILIVGFIGGIVFAGLVLVIGNPTFILTGNISDFLWDFSRPEFLHLTAMVLAFVSGLSVITVVVSLFALSQKFTPAGLWFLTKRIGGLVALDFAMFMTSLMLLLWPLVQYWAVFPQVILVVIFYAYLSTLKRARTL